VLDIGCASGYFLDEARAAGWDVVGSDVSPYARQRAGALGLDLIEHPAAAEPGSFDVVTLFQVLEHTVAPAETLRLAARALRPGGRLVVETWDRESAVARLLGARWQQASPPTVLHLFGRRSIDAGLRRAGLEPRSLRRSTKWVSAGFVASLAPGGLRLGRGVVGRLPLPYAFGDLVTATAVAR
jgi:SAM-dependent methyltransferase